METIKIRPRWEPGAKCISCGTQLSHKAKSYCTECLQWFQLYEANKKALELSRRLK